MQYNQPFFYKTRVHVSTIAGTPFADEANVDGPLVESRFTRPYYIAVDQEKNIFVGRYPNGSSGSLHRVRMINEGEKHGNHIIAIFNWWIYSFRYLFPLIKNNLFSADGSAQYYEFDPEKQWAPRRVTPIKNLEAGLLILENIA